MVPRKKVQKLEEKFTTNEGKWGEKMKLEKLEPLAVLQVCWLANFWQD